MLASDSLAFKTWIFMCKYLTRFTEVSAASTYHQLEQEDINSTVKQSTSYKLNHEL